MEKQTNTSDMLDLAVDYIKELQMQVKLVAHGVVSAVDFAAGDEGRPGELHLRGGQAAEELRQLTGPARLPSLHCTFAGAEVKTNGMLSSINQSTIPSSSRKQEMYYELVVLHEGH
ncbi:hypothetical protein TRIUR3_13760 [Triticum urartu]|uniref:BHLH domain-containing protein n=1 Tax=Triticum urartu TaxID=4572 RepID=M8ADX0_TRIUA|nr:hypothetical protein TRIUR3_13760 [Triticum urartu]